MDRKTQTEGVLKWWIKNIIFIIIIGATLFLASGNPYWGIAWFYLLCIIIIVVANYIAMDPSLLAERSQLQEGTKKWDVALSGFVAIWGPLLIWLLAGLDNRFEWSLGISLVLQIVALVFVVLGGLLSTWSMASNQFFASTVRIQTDRNHRVETKGPYQYIRHPGYTGGIICMLMTPIALGSIVALIPSILVICGFIVRTSLEDRMLKNELEGYDIYSKNVSYRLFPGIW